MVESSKGSSCCLSGFCVVDTLGSSKQTPVLLTVSPEVGRPKLGLQIGSMPRTPERMKRRRLVEEENEMDVSEGQSACRCCLPLEKGHRSIVIVEESPAPSVSQQCWCRSQTFHEAVSVLGCVYEVPCFETRKSIACCDRRFMGSPMCSSMGPASRDP